MNPLSLLLLATILCRCGMRSSCCVLQPYQPSLSAAWLFQRSMSLGVGQLKGVKGRAKREVGFLPPDHVNRLLACNFGVMRRLGDFVLRPFMQDTIRWWPLTLAMNAMVLADPVVVFRVLKQVCLRLLPACYKLCSDSRIYLN